MILERKNLTLYIVGVIIVLLVLLPGAFIHHVLILDIPFEFRSTIVPGAIALLLGTIMGHSLVLRQQVTHLAMMDSLTGLYNRHYYSDALVEDINHARAHGKRIAIAVFDIDHFKQINDQFGHTLGDSVLRAIGTLLTQQTSRDKYAIRWGGEEFLLVFFHKTLAEATEFCELLRQQFAECSVHGITFTCSFGVTTIAHNTTLSSAIERADAFMYEAKQRGRNRIVSDNDLKEHTPTTAKATSIVLVGMPGAGKSTVGVLLAKRLALGFVDTDILLQAQIGSALQAYLDTHGYQQLRDREHEMLQSLNLNKASLVVATGGSAVYSPHMQKLAEVAHIVYLKASLDTITKRIGEWSSRGVAAPAGQSMLQIYDERTRLYEQIATRTIETDQLSTEQVIAAIIQSIEHTEKPIS